jgi:protein-tyrosine-phosphatase
MKKYDRLIFVSNSDTCRGPMAEAILKSKFLLSELEVESRGLVVLFPEPVNQKAEAILASHGLTMKDHTAKMLEQEDFDERTLILVMEDALKQRIFQEHENVQNTWQLSEYIKEETDVTEPVGGSLADYGACYELLDCMISSLVVILNEEELLC